MRLPRSCTPRLPGGRKTTEYPFRIRLLHVSAHLVRNFLHGLRSAGRACIAHGVEDDLLRGRDRRNLGSYLSTRRRRPTKAADSSGLAVAARSESTGSRFPCPLPCRTDCWSPRARTASDPAVYLVSPYSGSLTLTPVVPAALGERWAELFLAMLDDYASEGASLWGMGLLSFLREFGTLKLL